MYFVILMLLNLLLLDQTTFTSGFYSSPVPFSSSRLSCQGRGKGANEQVAENKRAGFDYEWSETIVAGIQLTGIEAKSCRKGNVQISDGLAEVRNGELWLLNVFIPELKRCGPRQMHEPKRIRKLLVKKNEVLKLEQRSLQQNMEIIPIRIFFSDKNVVKVELGVGKQKSVIDKRDDMIQKEGDREIKRVMKSSSRGGWD